MFCPKCGKQNLDSSSFCQFCGSQIGVPQQQSAPQQQMQPRVEGVLSAAWSDIVSTPGWLKKIIVLAICNVIPFLGYGVTGYAEQWGCEVVRGKREAMPDQYFNNKNFLTGIFEYIIFAAYGAIIFVASLVVGGIFGLIPVLGVLIILAIIVFIWFWNSYVALCSMKSALSLDLGQGFSTKKLTNAYFRGIGGVFVSYFVPSLICGIICFILILIFIAIFMSIAAAGTSSVMQLASSPMSSDVVGNSIGAITGLATAGGITFVIFLLLIFFIVFVMAGFEKVLRYRALGHWIARNVPEFKEEPKSIFKE